MIASCPCNIATKLTYFVPGSQPKEENISMEIFVNETGEYTCRACYVLECEMKHIWISMVQISKRMLQKLIRFNTCSVDEIFDKLWPAQKWSLFCKQQF